jgi:hypothetical protein
VLSADNTLQQYFWHYDARTASPIVADLAYSLRTSERKRNIDNTRQRQTKKAKEHLAPWSEANTQRLALFDPP